MKRQSLELALAGWIFLAANAVYGVEALVGRNLSSNNPLIEITETNNNHNLALKVDDNSTIRVPTGFFWEFGKHESESSLCVDTFRGKASRGVNHPHKLSVQHSVPSFNYDLSVQTGSDGRELRLECADEGNVILKVSIDSRVSELLQKDVLIDTVTLVIQPE